MLVNMGEVYAMDDDGCFGSLAGDVNGMSKSKDHLISKESGRAWSLFLTF